MNEDIYTDLVSHIPTGETVANNVSCKINGEPTCVPMDSANRHWAEIMRQMEAGTLTITEAD